MSVHQERGRIGAGAAPFTDHHGMARRGFDGGREPDAREGISYELRRRRAISRVLGAGAHTRNTQEREQFVLRARFVGAAPGSEIGGDRGSGHRRAVGIDGRSEQ